MERDDSHRLVRLDVDRWSEVAGLQARCLSTPWDVKTLQTVFGNPWCRVLGAEEASSAALLGHAIFATQNKLCHLMDLAVLPEWRRRGIGSRLILAVCTDAADYGATTVFLEVRTSNATALAFYRCCGFFSMGRRAAYYPDTGEDALVLGKAISEPGDA